MRINWAKSHLCKARCHSRHRGRLTRHLGLPSRLLSLSQSLRCGGELTMAITQRRAIVIFPSAQDMAAVESMRQRFDPLADSIPAHITLVFPFESQMTDAELKAHVEIAVEGFKGFEIGLSEITASEDEYLFLNINRGRDEIVELHDRLYTGRLSNQLSSSFRYVPHVTVGRFAESHELREALFAASAAPIKLETRAESVSAYSLGRAPARRIAFNVRLG